ncbi:MAG: hypothetical protein ABIJ96_02755 [Elusimicrobiota bacterium]
MGNSSATYSTVPHDQQLRRDWWPLTRLLIVASVLASQAYWAFGWRVPLADLPALGGRILTAMFGMALISGALVYLCALLLMLLLLAFILMNGYSYDACYWTFRNIFRLRSHRLRAGFSLAGELALFVYGFFLLRCLLAVL